ncbi:MAG: MBL fold metallo-hydrolase [Spirochaetes bacterium]|nr:MAG: MBL fold metallo-hydrolase [Spirochaetota bacterium]
MKIITRSVGILSANCHIIIEDEGAIVIDPGGNPELIYPIISEKKLLYIINTHGHYDHIGANNDLKARFDTKLLIHKDDYEMLVNPDLNLSIMVDSQFISVLPDKLLEDGDELGFFDHKLEIIHTPGHTEGSICIKIGNFLFSGDTLFYHSIGRTDLPGGDFNKLKNSIKKKLYKLDDETLVYTGHGPNTTIGEEKKLNEFIKE